ncbi:MAG TPA: hypothetical protein VLA12_10750, partial [Planctomycetaceae bacterium]|nr:hypothetical protein [Planctomycetaceae bacterium]
DTAIEREASKTGWLHRIPRHYILCDPLPSEEYPLYRNQQTVRYSIKRYCDAAGVPYFTPQRLRVTAINRYEKSYPGAGAVIQGIALGSTLFRSYVDQFEFLKSAQEGLQIPDSMLPDSRVVRREMEEKRLISAFRTLPVDERGAILSLISRGK